jgi:hypothetical protein
VTTDHWQLTYTMKDGSTFTASQHGSMPSRSSQDVILLGRGERITAVTGTASSTEIQVRAHRFGGWGRRPNGCRTPLEVDSPRFSMKVSKRPPRVDLTMECMECWCSASPHLTPTDPPPWCRGFPVADNHSR